MDLNSISFWTILLSTCVSNIGWGNTYSLISCNCLLLGSTKLWLSSVLLLD